MVITDLTPYRPHIDRFDLTEEQKLQLVNTIAMMAESILDRHFKLNRRESSLFEKKGVDGSKPSSNGQRHEN